MAEENLQVDEAVVLEIGVKTTKAVRLEFIGQSFVLHDYWTEGPLIAAEGDAPKVNQENFARVLGRLVPRFKKVSLVINDASTFNVALKVPVSTEEGIRSHLQQLMVQAHKHDLSKHFWMVTPLSTGFEDQQALTEALSNKVNMLFSATNKESVELLHSVFRKAGIEIEHTFFHMPSVVKAFEFYGGSTFADQLLALLHLNENRYALGIVKNGRLLHFRELKFDRLLTSIQHPEIQQEIKNCLTGAESRHRAPVRCVFVSGNYDDSALFINELKDAGCYARSWSAARKLSFSSEANQRPHPDQDMARLNGVIGGALSVFEARRKIIAEPTLSASEEALSRLNVLVRPLALAACILIVTLVLLFNGNWLAEQRLRNEISSCLAQQRRARLQEIPLPRLHEQLSELEWFSSSRHKWLPIFQALEGVNVTGVELLQIRAIDTLGMVDPNPFEPVAKAGRKRKNIGTLVVEARNQAGLAGLETLIETVKTNQQVRPLLNRRKPFRLVNNLPAATTPGGPVDASLITVEYLFDEKTF